MNESNNQTIKIPTEDGDDDESSSFDLISADIQAFVPRSTSNNSLGTLNNSWTHVTDSGDVISLRHSNSSSNSSSIEVSDRSTTVEASIVSPLSCHQAEDDVSPLRTHVHSPDVSDESSIGDGIVPMTTLERDLAINWSPSIETSKESANKKIVTS